MTLFERTIVGIAFILMAAVTFWLQILFSETDNFIAGDSVEQSTYDIDYYIDNFTSTNIDNEGVASHVIEAGRMIHFSDNDSALLVTPHIIEYKSDVITQHTFSDSGWLSSGGEEILLINNVRVIEHNQNTGDSAPVLNTAKLKVRLKSKPGTTQ